MSNLPHECPESEVCIIVRHPLSALFHLLAGRAAALYQALKLARFA
jgi:hypothetical protein